jgi:hypothetical protein
MKAGPNFISISSLATFFGRVDILFTASRAADLLRLYHFLPLRLCVFA